jgi:hypothetical protein
LGTAKALQRLINAYLPEDQKLKVDGRIVSEIITSKKTAIVVDKMIVDNKEFVKEVIDFTTVRGHIQQQGSLPLATNYKL